MTRWLGILYALTSAILYAVTINIIPFAHAVGGSVMFYLCLRGIFNFGLTFIPSPNLGGVIGFSQQPYSLLALGLLFALQGFAYIQALHMIPISIATPIFFLFPVFIYPIQKILQRRRIRFIPILALCASSIGIWLFTQGSGDTSEETRLLGIFWALLGALTQAIANVILTRIQHLNSWQLLRASYLPSFIIFTLYAITQPLPNIEAIAWTALSAGVFFIGSILFILAIKLLGAIRTANVMYIEPILAVLFSLALHSDTLTMTKIFAIAFILGSTVTLELFEHHTRKRENF